MRLSLGTAQFGLDYGVTNAVGQVGSAAVARILRDAKAYGITDIDTAAAYGTAESVLGERDLSGFQISSKIPSLKSLPPQRAAEQVRSHARSSKEKLGAGLTALLLHDVGDILRPEGKLLWATLEHVAAELEVKSIGISIYTGWEIRKALKVISPDVVQLPISVLDQRLLDDGSLDLLSGKGISTEARSIFLQGLVLAAPHALPPYLRRLKPAMEKLHEEAAKANASVLELAIGFLKRTQRIDRAVVGVTSADELSAIQCAINAPLPAVSYPNFRVFDAMSLDPRQWPQLKEEKRAS